jgi:V/A-type H+/Na+-transporting ATPase subunit E
MKTLEKGQDKINKICAVLRDETLEPAQKEAQAIIDNANKQAEQIIAEAEKTAADFHTKAKAQIEQEHNVFQASLQQASKQSLETLRQAIEKKFFNEHLLDTIEKGMTDPQLIANLIQAISKAIEKEGLGADLTALVGKTIAPRQINELLAQDVLKHLKNHSVELGDFNTGVKLKLHDKKITIDISEQALKELLATYVVRKDFRKMFFNDQKH